MSAYTILALDPGNTETGWVHIESDTCRPIEFGKTDNRILRRSLPAADCSVIEMVASYGMAVGKDVFETCVWIGRFLERLDGRAALVYRREVKLHHCGSSRAKDANITQALVDRFASGGRNHGKGAKAAPGFFYGFHRDIWQAFALAVYAADTREG